MEVGLTLHIIPRSNVLPVNTLKYQCLHLRPHVTDAQLDLFWSKHIVKYDKTIGGVELPYLLGVESGDIKRTDETLPIYGERARPVDLFILHHKY